MNPPAREQFMALLREGVEAGSIIKVTLGKPSGATPTLLNLYVRPVTLKSGPHFAFVWRHATKDVTKNHGSTEAIRIVDSMIGTEFLDAHLFTTVKDAQLEMGAGNSRLRVSLPAKARAVPLGNDRAKNHPIRSASHWLRALGVTDIQGRPLAAMRDKFRQIEKFAEIFARLIKESPVPKGRPLTVFDMGCGKGYLTFAISDLLGDRGLVVGIEARPELVDFCETTVRELAIADRLSFRLGSIAETAVGTADVLVALHACDTATDDAIAKGVQAGVALLVVAPCCQKEVRPQLVAPQVLAPALKHGIFEERQAEFVTDALRALLLEWAGYRTRVIEFISTEHTAKNTMITAVKLSGGRGEEAARAVRDFAAFCGVRHQALASQLGFNLR